MDAYIIYRKQSFTEHKAFLKVVILNSKEKLIVTEYGIFLHEEQKPSAQYFKFKEEVKMYSKCIVVNI